MHAAWVTEVLGSERLTGAALYGVGHDAQALPCCRFLGPQGEGDNIMPLSGEGGHVTLPATDDREAAVIAMIRQAQGHVSAERLVSGAGLMNLYAALKTLAGRIQTSTLTSPARLTDAVNRPAV